MEILIPLLIVLVLTLIFLKKTSTTIGTAAPPPKKVCSGFNMFSPSDYYTCPTNYTVSGSSCVPNQSDITGLTCDSTYFTANFATNKCVPK